MAFCCDNPTFIGCFDSCQPIVLTDTYPSTGDFTIKYALLGTVQMVTVAGVIGAPIILPAIFNEYGEPLVSIDDPNGDPVTLSGGECIKFKISPNFL